MGNDETVAALGVISHALLCSVPIGFPRLISNTERPRYYLLSIHEVCDEYGAATEKSAPLNSASLNGVDKTRDIWPSFHH
jgi:hypothetical protein